jgi:hypothetical protein
MTKDEGQLVATRGTMSASADATTPAGGLSVETGGGMSASGPDSL